MDKAKDFKKVKYWIQYRLPAGKQRKEYVGFSIEEARDAEGKRRVQKREHRIFDMLPEAKVTFTELTEWYLNLKAVNKLASYNRVKGCLSNFNNVFGSRLINSLQPMDLEDYQDSREDEGAAPRTIDNEIGIAQAMVDKAFHNDKIDRWKIEYGRDSGIIFHDIRGSVKTNMAKAGIETSLRNAPLGHSQQGMDKHYLRFLDEDLRAAMDKYTEWLDAQIQNVAQNVAQDEKK